MNKILEIDFSVLHQRIILNCDMVREILETNSTMMTEAACFYLQCVGDDWLGLAWLGCRAELSRVEQSESVMIMENKQTENRP